MCYVDMSPPWIQKPYVSPYGGGWDRWQPYTPTFTTNYPTFVTEKTTVAKREYRTPYRLGRYTPSREERG